MTKQRVVISAMAVNTCLGDTLDDFFDSLISGRSGITKWKHIETAGVYSKIGGDLGGYDVNAKVAALSETLPEQMHKRLRKLIKKAPFSTALSLLVAADAYLDAGLEGHYDPAEVAVIVGGHNLNKMYQHRNYLQFVEEPDYIDSQASVLSLDTDHASSVGELLGVYGPIYTVGGACASSNIALRAGLDEILYHDCDVAVVVGATLEFTPMDLHAMALMSAISFQSFNDAPEKASRPYDVDREGFIPSHGTGVIVLERLERALDRGAPVHAEVLGITATSDGCHLPSPSVEGQSRTVARLLQRARVAPEEVDFVSAHATSTPLGDLTELRSLKETFGDHVYKLKINAPKSMLGHTCWSAPVIETIAAVLQVNRGWLHPSINIDKLDPEVDVDVCANEPRQYDVRTFLKNSFGFGGINCCGLYRKYEG